MQRSKIKVDSDYAASNYRDWYQHAIKAVQVLDVGFWPHLSNWDKEAAAAPPATVPEPHRPTAEVVQVPGTLRRGDGRFSRDRHTALVRPFPDPRAGPRTSGKPSTPPTQA